MNAQVALTSAAASAQRAAREFYRELNARLYGGKLPDDLAIEFTARLTATAGTCLCFSRPGRSRRRRGASIALSQSVVSDLSRLRTTLAHEVCHAAAWLLHGARRPPHGPKFRELAQRTHEVRSSMNVLQGPLPLACVRVHLPICAQNIQDVSAARCVAL